MNLMAESRKNEDLVDLQCFIKGQENEDSAQQNPVGRIITPWGPADSLQQEGTRQKQKCAEQRGQIQLPIHVDHGQPVFIGPEDVDPQLSEYKIGGRGSSVNPQNVHPQSSECCQIQKRSLGVNCGTHKCTLPIE